MVAPNEYGDRLPPSGIEQGLDELPGRDFQKSRDLFNRPSSGRGTGVSER